MLVNTAMAQGKFSDDVQKFIPDLKLNMTATKNQDLINMANEFEGVFSGLSPAQQKKIVSLSQTLQKKKFKPNPTYQLFFQGVGLAVKAQYPKVDSLLWVTEQVLADYKPKMVDNYLNTVKTVFEKRALYSTNFNSLQMVGGDFSFGYSSAKTDNADVFTEQPVETTTETKTEEKPADETFSDWDKPAEQVAEETLPVEEDLAGNADLNAAVYGAGYTEPVLPTVTGAFIKVTNVDLVMITKNDSSTIRQTNGVLIIDSRAFNGNGGSMDWSVAGLPEASGKFKKYGFNAKNARVEAEGFTLDYPSKIDKPVEGVFLYQSSTHKKEGDYKYPRFMSYSNRVTIKDLGNDIKYLGGFALEGKRIYSSSVDQSPSKIEISEGGVLKFRAVSYKYEFTEKNIMADLSSTVIFINKDSITHPGLRIDFEKETKLLKLYRETRAFNNTYFRDTYHKMEINAEGVRWILTTPVIDFQMLTGRSETPVELKSFEYFNNNEYDRLKGLLPFHPLLMPITYAKKHKVKTFLVDDMSKENKLNAQTVRTAMVDMSRRGMVDYNAQSGKMRITEKGQHYYDSKTGKKDFDNIYMKSIVTNKANASLDMSTNELSINGVKEFYLSDTLNVYIRPEKEQLKILKNRDFSFDGKLYAANYIFQGQKNKFNYDSFSVTMEQIDSMKLKVVTPEKDLKGKLITRELSSQIESSAGVLYINKPYNKSAKKHFPQYPIFKSSKGSFVYYDDVKILNGIYGKNVFFEVPPFTLDSMNSSSHGGVKFKGKFKSNGIIPDIDEILTVMPDLSLGFQHKCPAEGLPLYKGKAKLFNEFSVSNKGMRGNGTITHLTGEFKSEDFILYPDSTRGIGKEMVIKEGKLGKTICPDVTGKAFSMFWKVPQDTMLITSIDTAFAMYSKSVHLNGTLLLTPTGLLGRGKLDTRGSETASLDYHFEKDKYVARKAIFKVLAGTGEAPALESKNVKLDFDLSKGHAHFSPETAGFASNDFPYLKYKTSLGDGDWDLNKKTISFHKPDSVKITNSYFYSTRLDQDSLVFSATKASYDITQKTLNIKGVPFILVGDSKVLPDSGKVVIRENAEMEDLKNAGLLIDSLKGRFKLHNGNISVRSRKMFVGDAIYTYINSDSAKFDLKFSDFVYTNVLGDDEGKKRKSKNETKEYRTHAKALVREEDSLRIEPKILYKGDVMLFAEKPELAFSGYALFDLKAYQGNANWLKYENNGDSAAVKIDVKDIKAVDGTPLVSGFELDKMQQLYSTFLSKKKNAEDRDVFIAKDNFSFSEKTNDFTIGELDRLSGKKLSGNLFSYNDNTQKIHFEGKVNLFDDYKDFEVHSAVIGNGSLDSNKIDFNTMISIKMTIPEPALLTMGNYLNSYGMSGSLQKVIGENRLPIAQKLADLTNDKDGQSFMSANLMENKPLLSFNKDLPKEFLISEVNLRWSPEHHAWYSIGKIGISHILKTDINYFFEGYLEIEKTENGDLFFLYLEPTPGTWYFMSFESNKFSLVSSDPGFNSLISSKSKGEQTKGRYYFVTAEELEKSLFLKDFKTNYLGLDVSLESNAPVDQKQEEPVEEQHVAPKEKEHDAVDESATTEEEAPVVEKKKKKKEKKKKETIVAPEKTEPAKVKEEEEEKEEPTVAPKKEEESSEEKAPEEEQPTKKKKKGKKESKSEEEGF